MRPLLFLAVRRFWNSIRSGIKKPRVLIPILLLLLSQSSVVFSLIYSGHSNRVRQERQQAREERRLRTAERRGDDRPAPRMATSRPDALSPASRSSRERRRAPLSLPAPANTEQVNNLVASVRAILLLSLFTSLVSALGEGGLFFTQSDVDFLFPAPLSRRAVLLFKMLGRYFGLLLPAMYIPFIVGGPIAREAGVSGFGFLPGILGAWLFLIAVTNTAQAVLLNRVDKTDGVTDDENPAVQQRKRLQKILGWSLLAFIAIGAYALYDGLVSEGPSDVLGEAVRLLNGRAVDLLLFPVGWASDLFRAAFHAWTIADTGRVVGLFALTAASFALLFSRDRDFYEGALEISARRLKAVQAVQKGDAGSILSQMAQEGKFNKGREVRAIGTGARAILWKDLIAVTRTPLKSWGTLLLVASIPAILSQVVGRGFTSGGTGGIAGPNGSPSMATNGFGVLMWLFIFTLNMSSLFLLSLRDMLRRADISKALPIPPARLLLAELALSIAQLTILGWFSLGLMTAFSGAGPTTLIAFVVLPSLAALILFVQTSFVLLYPNQNDPAQNSVSGLLSVFASILALIPGVSVGITVYLLTDGKSPALLGLAVGATNLLAAAVALAFASFLWQRFDPSDT